jgi:hypothetical protein
VLAGRRGVGFRPIHAAVVAPRKPLSACGRRRYRAYVKHVTFADKSILVDDQTADVILEYAALLARAGDADNVTIHGFNSDGQEVEATMLLDAGAPLMAESTHTSLPDPDNEAVLSYMREQVIRRSSPAPVAPENDHMPANYEDLDL